MSLAHCEQRKILIVFFIGVFLTTALFIAGCKKNDSNPLNNSAAVSDDVADVADGVSDALASNNGGAMDQVNDVFEFAGGVGVGSGTLSKTSGDTMIAGAVYDGATMSWTKTIVKRDSLSPLNFGYWTRDYWLQFRANGQPQKFRNTNGVAADSIKHKLQSGTGYFRTPRLVHYLLSIGSDWTASNTNTGTVTINGTYSRSGIDTIKVAARKGRILRDTLSLTFENVKGPRAARFSRSENTSGTIEGTYTATVTTSAGATHTFTKTFTIVLGGGNATFLIDGSRYVADLATGDH